MEAVDMDTMSHSYHQPQSHPQSHPSHGFDVVAAFSKLETNRKMALFDQLMCGRANAYRNTLKSFWPESDDADARKLEIVLRVRLDRLKKYS